jgi:hypothetical protein
VRVWQLPDCAPCMMTPSYQKMMESRMMGTWEPRQAIGICFGLMISFALWMSFALMILAEAG